MHWLLMIGKTIGAALLVPALASAQVSLDTVSADGVESTGAMSWTHTPGDTPEGVVCFIAQETGLTDEVTGVTYALAGEQVTLLEVALSENCVDDVEDGCVYAYFAGSGFPSGAKQVDVTVNGTASQKTAYCVSVNAATDTEVVDTSVITDTNCSGETNVTVELGGRSALVVEGFLTGAQNQTVVTAITGWTEQSFLDHGPMTSEVHTYDTIGTSDVTAGFDQTGAATDCTAIAVAISEVEATGLSVGGLQLLGVGR